MGRKLFFISSVILVAAATLGFTCGSGEPVYALKAGSRVVPEFSHLKAWSGATPIELTWKVLADVQYKDIYVEELDSYYWKPTFGATVKAMEGKEVFITGYLIPVDYEENFYVISRYPYAQCFFCGGGGPESVVDLRFSDTHRVYKTDERLTFKGKLKLNADNIYEMNYILTNAVEYLP
jgi:hypothetical protein